jgi:hypothetical protein
MVIVFAGVAVLFLGNMLLGVWLRPVFNWIDEHHAGRLAGFGYVALAVLLYYMLAPKISALVDHFFDRQ